MLTRIKNIKKIDETEKEQLMSTLQFKEITQPEPTKDNEKEQEEEDELDLFDL